LTITIHPRVESIPQAIIDAYESIGVGDIGHIQTFGFMDTGIRPVWQDLRLVGPALTVRMPPMDITANRAAISAAKPGDVIVVDRMNTTEDACWGGVAALLAKEQGAAGLIVDGAVTDSMEFADLKWPAYSRTISGLVGRVKGDAGVGEINVPISCGGVPVNPGDLIVADNDGIVVIRPHEAETLLKAVQDRFGSHPNIRQWVRDGKPLREYPHAKEFFGDQ
jgi:4-hydroxy-4-methyl-2-oxoglutarate aldolase